MFVNDSGPRDGSAVVFIPGLGCDHTMYEPQYAAIREFRCLTVDLPGTGRSGSLAGVPAGDVIERQAAAVAAALDERGIDSAHAVGVSYGGAIVQQLLLRHSDRVRSAVICDSLCDTRPRSWSERLLMWGARTQPLMYRMPRRWLAAMVRHSYSRWPRAGQAMADAVATARRDDLIVQRRAINQIRFEDALPSVSCPTLCLVGDDVPQAVDMMRRVHEAIPGSEFRIFQDSFDPSNLCQPAEFTTTLRSWINDVEKRNVSGAP